MAQWRRLLVGACVALASGYLEASAQDITDDRWGITFATSVSGSAQRHFLDGLTALHLFMYEDAIEHFQSAEREAPSFAMAYWGEALAHYRPIWSLYNRDKARAALAGLAPTVEARSAKAPTPREKAYLAAVETLFADGPPRERQRAYADQMERVAARYPDDTEALALYCVSRVMLYPRASEARARMETAAIALDVLARNPRHPGAPRYLIQATDDPAHASLGLAGVRAMGAWTDPGGAESIHIPSHVYIQLGNWDAAERANARAFEVSMAWTTAHKFGLADLNLHDYEHLLRWRQYSLLQLGRVAEAKALTDRAGTDYPASKKATSIGTAFYRLRAQFMLETGQWALVADLARQATADGYDGNPFVLQAIGLGAAKTGDLTLARSVAGRLRQSRDWRGQAEAEEVLGLVALAEKDEAGALGHLKEAVAIDEKNVGSHGLGVPEPSKPVWELCGEALLELHRPKEALAQFERSLEIYRGRAASLLGASRASREQGDRVKADTYAAALRSNWHAADPNLPGLSDVRPPNPYHLDEGWAKLPAGRTLGAAGAIDIDRDGRSVWVFDRCGTPETCVGSTLAPIMKFDASGRLVANFGAGLFNYPHGLSVDRDNNVWVSDASAGSGKGQTVMKFSPDGRLLMTLGRPGVSGNGPDTFNAPSDVLVSPRGEIFVADGHGGSRLPGPSTGPPTNARIVKLSKDGTFIKAWGRKGTAPGEFDVPHGLAMDAAGRLFVADRSNGRIQIFDQEGTFLEQWTQFGRPSGIFIDAHDILYVADSTSNDQTNPGYTQGIRIGSVKDGRVTAFIPWSEPNTIEAVAADEHGNVYAGYTATMNLRRFVKD